MSLDLDQRQRAMLQEMQVRVWWPPSTAAAKATGLAHEVVAPATDVPQAAAAIEAMDWPALAQTIADCVACKLCVGRKAAVFKAEPVARQADWLVVGEPPDEEEERDGAAFAGLSGQLLDNMLRAVQVTRDGVGSAGARLANVVKCRPAMVRIAQPGELASCAVYLRREIDLIRPKVILAMGRFAAQSLLGASHPELANVPFGKLRGQVYRYHAVPVVVTYHPVSLLRAQHAKAQAWADLCLAQTLARRPLAQDSASARPPETV